MSADVVVDVGDGGGGEPSAAPGDVELTAPETPSSPSKAKRMSKTFSSFVMTKKFSKKQSSYLRNSKKRAEALANITRNLKVPGLSSAKEKIKARLTSHDQGSRNVGGHPPVNKSSYDEIESVDYSTPDTAEQAAYNKATSASHRKWRGCFMWFVYLCIGIAVSLFVTYVLQLCDLIQYGRVNLAMGYFESNNLGMAWFSWVGTSLLLSLGACFFVLLEPAAASSGIPAILGYLNGVVPKAGDSLITGMKTSYLSWETMLAKALGMILSIPSGLCIGPEGPIIHVSALLARWTGKAINRIEQWMFPFLVLAPRASESRDFLASGGGCGIAAAFRAPLSGVLFVVEEASSHITVKHIERTFLACVVTYFVGRLIYQPDESFSKFKQPTGKFCSRFDFVSSLLALVTAVTGGVIGAAFNQTVEHLTHLRNHHINKSKWRRLGEVTVICVLTGTIAVFLPMAWPCREMTPSLIVRDSIGCMSPTTRAQIFAGEIKYTTMQSIAENSNVNSSSAEIFRLATKYRVPEKHWPSGKDKAFYDVINLPKGGATVKLNYPLSYTCSGKYQYNEMAGLWLKGGVAAAKTLMERGFPTELSASTLIVFFFVYFVLAALTAGISVPAGLVIPMMCMGGSFGRLVGLAAMEVKRTGGCTAYGSLDHKLAETNLYYWSGTYRWELFDCAMPDPGTFAVLGMAAVMGGSGRITVMLAAVLVELTGDPFLIAPIGLTTIIAMIVGNFFNHGLYHGLIPLMNLPYLNPIPSELMWVSKVEEVMTYHVVSVKKLLKIRDLEALLKKIEKGDITHNAFPVVAGGDMEGRLDGLITKDRLLDAYHAYQSHDGIKLGFINLWNYMERSPLTVFPHTRLGRAYEVFQKLGMRHMIVTDRAGCVAGMMTRKNFQEYLIKDNAIVARVQAILRGRLARFRYMKKERSMSEAKEVPEIYEKAEKDGKSKTS